MSLASALRALAVAGRSPAPVRRAELELDAGAMMTPELYPYGPGRRPVAPFVARIILPGRERSRAQLAPPTGNPTSRRFAHIDYAARSAAVLASRRDVSGRSQPAKITRTRPWLFAGGSSATAADKLAAAPGASSSAGGCDGC